MQEKYTESTIDKESVLNVWCRHPRFRLLFKGLIISLPIIIVIFILSLVLEVVFGLISPITYLIAPGYDDPHWMVHLLSLLIVFAVFYFIGLSVKKKRGQLIFNWLEKDYFNHIPLYRPIRELVQQFSGLNNLPFKQVVLIDPFDNGVLMTGFVTERLSEEIYTVFVPTAPNPTNGNIYHVPKTRLEFVSTTAESAMRTIVGMGTGSNCLFEKKEEDLICQSYEAYL